jgi:hypothetical protein
MHSPSSAQKMWLWNLTNGVPKRTQASHVVMCIVWMHTTLWDLVCLDVL